VRLSSDIFLLHCSLPVLYLHLFQIVFSEICASILRYELVHRICLSRPLSIVVSSQFKLKHTFSLAVPYHFIHHCHNLKPNSWTYSFFEVSGHNLESSQTWGFCMDFLNHREGGMVFFYQVFPLSTLMFTEIEQEKLWEVVWVWRNISIKAKL
jgi:hypothetical protein